MDKEKATELLFSAAETGNLENARKALNAGANVNAKDKYGATPLHNAADYGQLAIGEFLIAYGANINAADNIAQTPWNYATRSTHREFANMLSTAVKQQQGHTGRVTEERKDKGPRQPGG